VTVGWRFSPTIWGKGYATEAATAVLDQAFTKMALDRVWCITNAQNLRSVRVAERLGMTFMAEASVPSDDGTRMVTGKLFQIARDDWLTARKDRSPRTSPPIGARPRRCRTGHHEHLPNVVTQRAGKLVKERA
jgi:hypothetical protein